MRIGYEASPSIVAEGLYLFDPLLADCLENPKTIPEISTVAAVTARGSAPLIFPSWRCTMRWRLMYLSLIALGSLLLIGIPAATSQDAGKDKAADVKPLAEKKVVAISVLLPQDDATLSFEN